MSRLASAFLLPLLLVLLALPVALRADEPAGASTASPARPAGAGETTQPQLPAAVERTLWCGSAFYWLGANALDAGDLDEAEEYEGWSETLMTEGADDLRQLGMAPGDVDALLGAFDTAVLGELGTPAARYDIALCLDLLAGR